MKSNLTKDNKRAQLRMTKLETQVQERELYKQQMENIMMMGSMAAQQNINGNHMTNGKHKHD